MAPIADLAPATTAFAEEDELFASWPGPFDSNLADDGFGHFLEAVPSCTGSCPADYDRRVVAPGSFSSGSKPTRLQKGRSLSSELAPATAEPESKKLTAAERKLQSNRKAQKRFRQKQKERSQDAEIRLLETSAKLQEMQMKQKELEARNMLLEKVARLSKQNVTRNCNPKDTKSVAWEGESTWQLQPMTNTRTDAKTLTLTVWENEERTFTIEQASQMPLPDFGKIWQEYVTKLGACLVEVRSDTDDSTPCAPTLQLHKWAAEATSLMVCVALRNPWAIKAFNAAVDTNTAAEERDAGCTAQQAHSAQLLTVLQYTEEQELDLMHLRCLFYGKIGQLCRERRSLLKQMGTSQDVGAGIGLDDVSVRLSEVSNLAERLQANGADEYRTYMQFTSAFLRGVHTSRQLAATIVHTHPWVPCKHLLLEELAAQQAEPADHELLNTAETDLVDYALQWQEVVQYLERITPANLHRHVPLRHAHQHPLQPEMGQEFDDVTLAQEVLDALL